MWLPLYCIAIHLGDGNLRHVALEDCVCEKDIRPILELRPELYPLSSFTFLF
jgi:hypothetical protein